MINNLRDVIVSVLSSRCNINLHLISGQDPLDPQAVRVRGMEVEEELVGDAAVGREARAETQRRKQLVGVVILNDVADGANSLFEGTFRWNSF